MGGPTPQRGEGELIKRSLEKSNTSGKGNEVHGIKKERVRGIVVTYKVRFTIAASGTSKFDEREKEKEFEERSSRNKTAGEKPSTSPC